MSWPAFRAILAATVHIGCATPLMCQDEPKDVTLPMLEVPDGLGKPGRVIRRPERSELLGSSIELSNTADQRFAARDQATWKRLSGSVCSSCGETQRIRKIDYVDPIAVLNAKVAPFRQTALASREAQPPHNRSIEALNAKVAPFRQTVLASRAVQPSHKHRVRLTHRRKHKSTLYAYYSRFRYTLLKWRKQHRHRNRLVQR
jgi:hypothetical protein